MRTHGLGLTDGNIGTQRWGAGGGFSILPEDTWLTEKFDVSTMPTSSRKEVYLEIDHTARIDHLFSFGRLKISTNQVFTKR